MLNFIQKYAGVVALLAIALSYLLPSALTVGSGYNHLQKEYFVQGLTAGPRSQFSVSNTGAVTSSQSITLTGASGDLYTGDRLGVASTSPFGKVGIGTSAGTSSISGGRFCMYFATEAGQAFYIKLNPTGATLFSTSTTSCF